MADYLTLLKKGAGLADLDDEIELIEALAETAKKWVALARKIDGTESLDTFLTSLATGIDGDKVKAAFEELDLGSTRATISRLLGKLTDTSGKIPRKYKDLFEPLSRHDDGGLVDWTLKLGKEAKVGEQVKLGLSANGTLAFDAGARLKLEGLEEKPRLRIGAAAGVKANADGAFPIRFGKVTAKAEASVGVALDYYFDPDTRDTLFIAAVATRILALPDPFSFDHVWEAFQERPDLDALVYSFADAASTEVGVALSATGSLPQQILADVKLTIGAKASVKNNFKLSLAALPAAPGQARPIEVRLGRTSASEAGLNLGLDVGLDFSAPFGRVRDLLDRAVERSDEVLAKVTPFLSPGTWLRTKFKDLVEKQAEALIEDEELRAALVQDMQKLVSAPSPDGSKLLDWLTGKVTDAIDRAAKDFTRRGEDARDRIIAQIAGALPEPLRGPFRDKATVAIGPLVDKITDKLKAQLDALLPDAKFGEALADIGAVVDGRLNTLDEALAGIRKLIDRYNELLQKAQAFASDAARAKVSASLKIEELWNWGLEEKVVGTFTAKTDQAREIFRQLSHGDLEKVRKLILTGPLAPATPGFALNRGASSIKRSAGRTSKENFEIVLFGFGMSASALLNGTGEILIDGNGEVQVDARARLEKRFKSGGEEREADFFNNFSLRLAKAAEGSALGTRSIEVGVGLSYIDEKLKRDELRDHVASLVKAGLVTSDTSAAADAVFGSWSPQGKAIAANLATKFELSHDQVRRLLVLDRLPAGQLDRAARKALIDTAVEAGEKLGSDRDTLNVGKVRFEQATDRLPRPMNAFMLGLIEEGWDPDREYPNRLERNSNVRALIAEFVRLKTLIEMFDGLRDIYNAQPRIDETSPAASWSERKYAAEEARVAKAGARWILAGGKQAEIPAATVTFLATICDLLDIPRLVDGQPAKEGTDAVALTLSRRKADNSVAEEVPLTQVADG